MVELSTFFQRCYVVNLDRRADRIESCMAALTKDWPFVQPVRWQAIDGEKVPHPTWWKVGKGAWGCRQSHAGILERCLMDDVQTCLFLEDDALPCPDFTNRVRDFLEHVPADWQMLYLGGQHLFVEAHPPTPINAHVCRPHNVNRTHAFGLNRAGMERVYRHIMRRDWQPGHHIDHHFGRLHVANALPVYCPTEWLIGQAESKSNIAGRECPVRFWNAWHQKKHQPPGKRPPPSVVAVLGTMRSGTSCVAGMIHALGVLMGHNFKPPNKHNPRGFWEALPLRDICWQCYQEPRLQARTTHHERVALLRRWAANRRNDGPLIGAKHPTLCIMVPDMKEAWPDLRAITLDRPLDDVMASLRCAKWTWKMMPAEQRELLQSMLRKRDADLTRLDVPTLKLAFAEIMANPADTIQKIVDFLGITPSDAQRAAAIAHVAPELNHHTAMAA